MDSVRDLQPFCGRNPMRRPRKFKTKRAWLTIPLLLIGLGPALAQQAPKAVKTETIRTTAPGFAYLYAMDEETGSVRVNWELAENIVATKSDRAALPIAQLMLAIRDGKWKPMR